MPAGDGHDVAYPGGLTGHRRLHLAEVVDTVADLALEVVTPAPHSAVRPEREGVGLSGGDGDDVGQPGHLARDDRRRGGVPSDTQLELVVVSPGPHSAVVFERNAEVFPGGDSRDAGQAGDLPRHTGLAQTDRLAETAVEVVAPSPNGAVVVDIQEVVAAASDPFWRVAALSAGVTHDRLRQLGVRGVLRVGDVGPHIGCVRTG